MLSRRYRSLTFSTWCFTKFTTRLSCALFPNICRARTSTKRANSGNLSALHIMSVITQLWWRTLIIPFATKWNLSTLVRSFAGLYLTSMTSSIVSLILLETDFTNTAAADFLILLKIISVTFLSDVKSVGQSISLVKMLQIVFHLLNPGFIVRFVGLHCRSRFHRLGPIYTVLPMSRPYCLEWLVAHYSSTLEIALCLASNGHHAPFQSCLLLDRQYPNFLNSIVISCSSFNAEHESRLLWARNRSCSTSSWNPTDCR